MNKEKIKKFFVEDNLLIIIEGILISSLLIGFLIFGLSNPVATYVNTSNSTIDLQLSYEHKFLDEYEQGDYSKTDPYFILDPYNISPLSGLMMFDTTDPTTFKLVIKGKTMEADIEYVSRNTIRHLLPVYSLYAGYINTVELYEMLDDNTEVLVSTLSIETALLPEVIALPTVIETTYDYFGDNLMMVMPAINSLPAAYDFNGDVRWYLSENLSWAPAMLKNGRLLLGTNKLISDPYYTTGLYEIDYLGKILTEFKIPGGYHHDVFEMESGNLLISTSDFDGTVEDVVIEMDRESGNIVNTWDIGDFLPELDGMSEMWTTYDWFHNNSVFYDKATDSIILSGRHQDAVISIGYTTNTLNWVIGDPGNWGTDFVADYFFTPIGANFEWQYAQHSAIVLEDGNIFLFDNGNNKSKFRETDIEPYNSYSRGVIYDIDTTSMTIEQVYQFGKELGPDFYSPYISNVEYYGPGNYLIHSGGHSEVNEQVLNIPAPLSEHFGDAVLNSITIEVLDDEEVYRLELSNNYYRARKISIYNSHTGVRFGEAKVIGAMAITSVTEDNIDTRNNFFDTVPSRYDISLLKESDRLEFKGEFDKDELIYLSLENDDQKLIYHVSTSSTTYTAMCIAIFEGDERFVTFHINEENVSGTFKVYLYVDGHKYDTYQKVVFKEK